jgi:hypothetical protein
VSGIVNNIRQDGINGATDSVTLEILSHLPLQIRPCQRLDRIQHRQPFFVSMQAIQFTTGLHPQPKAIRYLEIPRQSHGGIKAKRGFFTRQLSQTDRVIL